MSKLLKNSDQIPSYRNLGQPTLIEDQKKEGSTFAGGAMTSRLMSFSYLRGGFFLLIFCTLSFLSAPQYAHAKKRKKSSVLIDY